MTKNVTFCCFYFLLHFLALKVPINIIKLKRNKTGKPRFHGSHVFSIASRNKTKTTLILKLAELGNVHKGCPMFGWVGISSKIGQNGTR